MPKRPATVSNWEGLASLGVCEGIVEVSTVMPKPYGIDLLTDQRG
jgi:hypothetical protein